jgi:hypothetical protein
MISLLLKILYHYVITALAVGRPGNPARKAAKTQPLPGCPARHGKGADIRAADFILVADDCVTGIDGQPTLTSVFGYFRLPGEEHDDDVLLTGDLEVPARSPIAEIAHRVSADSDCMWTAGKLLRSNVIHCPCETSDDCPALNEVRLLEAMERAIGSRASQSASS